MIYFDPLKANSNPLILINGETEIQTKVTIATSWHTNYKAQVLPKPLPLHSAKLTPRVLAL